MNHEQLEQLCMQLPGTEIDIKWGNDLCYVVGKKMYCITGLNPPLQVSLKVLPEKFGELTEREGIFPAPYLARYKWILVREPNTLSAKEWNELIPQSYQLVFDKLPRREKQAIEG